MTDLLFQMDSTKKLASSPELVFREENDDWAIVFDPESGKTFTLNPVSALIWKHLDGNHNIEEVKEKVSQLCVQVPDGAGDHVVSFVEQLMKKNLVSFV